MRIILSFFSVLFLLTTAVSGIAQNNSIYEIPFSTDKRLLVFTGKLNGIEANFAFDTGAAEGIANTKHEQNSGVERQNTKQKISDGNGKIAYLQTANTKELTIGGFTFKNVRASINDMQYLYCMDLYLLGADVIRQLNWEIDFEKSILKVSKNRFITNENMIPIPVQYAYNTPRIEYSINGKTYKNVLIDFGFTGEMTLPTTDKRIKELVAVKRQQQLINAEMTTSFAAVSTPKPALTEVIFIDSIKMNDHYFYKIPADFKANTDFKIGLSFFTSTCKKLIINNTDKKYYLQLKENQDFKSSFSVAVILTAGKLKINSLSIDTEPNDKLLTINEEIKAINNKTADDFKSECDFLTWFYLTKWDRHTIEKLDGQILTFERMPLKGK